MKRTITFAMVCLLVAGTTYLGFATAAEMGKAKPAKVVASGGAKAEDVNITGKLSCTFCKLAHPDMSCKPDCCVSCVKAGDPPLLTDAEGNMYLLLTGEKEVPLMTPERMKMVGGKVVVKGLFVKGKGIQAIYVDSLEKAEDKEPKEKKQ